MQIISRISIYTFSGNPAYLIYIYFLREKCIFNKIVKAQIHSVAHLNPSLCYEKKYGYFPPGFKFLGRFSPFLYATQALRVSRRIALIFSKTFRH